MERCRMPRERRGAGRASAAPPDGGKPVKVAILDDYHNVALGLADWSRLRPACAIEVFDQPLAVPEEAARVLEPYDVICTLRERMPVTAELIARLPRLKHIVVTGKRYDTIDAAAAAQRGILVSTCPPGRLAGAGGVVELVWGLILGAARNIALEDRMMRQGGWQNTLGTTLGGKTLGIVGLGNLGSRVARIGQAFGMSVIAWSDRLTAERAAGHGVTRVEKDELFARSDVVSLHMVLSERTRGLVGARELALMKPTAILVNTARGALIDEDALVAVLRAKRIACAALDVYATEPLPLDHPLRQLDGTLLTPHLGYYTETTLRDYYRGAVKNIAAWLGGNPIRLVPESVAASDT